MTDDERKKLGIAKPKPQADEAPPQGPPPSPPKPPELDEPIGP